MQCRCRSRARASLRTRHHGPSIMGFEDQAEQSLPRPCREMNGRPKRTYELTSSIVPRGTSFHPHAAATSRVHRNSVPVEEPSTASKADLTRSPSHVRFSNRPTEVKRFQTIHLCGVDVARGLALLFGIGTTALPSWDSRIRWNNLCRGLAVR